MPVISAVADAVRDELAAGTFSLPFKAIRAFRHDQTLPEGRELRVSVVPNAVKATPAARAVCHYDMEIYVAVTKKIDRATPEVIDPLLGLVRKSSTFSGSGGWRNIPARCGCPPRTGRWFPVSIWKA